MRGCEWNLGIAWSLRRWDSTLIVKCWRTLVILTFCSCEILYRIVAHQLSFAIARIATRFVATYNLA
ncbi:MULTISPECIES: hypothetical protein [unclassified Helicobacter]|uniref:hypothetical protein n=1 Tax=unclassified Helicobacter TaxID=2593540 RepID=UPI0011BEA8CF|nr:MULTISPECIES: hypothetical protein [unclassified Helicobacter]MCI7764956.1 hypothetical protein [Helicobacter sp.]MDY5616006.1 hypothetical protein [Helicobacter sp.]